MVLGQVRVENKSNEIAVIPCLLDLLHIKGAIVTVDAAGRQEAIVNKIVERGGQFVLAVKNNQPTLYADVHIAFHDVDIAGEAVFAPQTGTEEVARVREKSRHYKTLDARASVTHANKWSHVRTLIRVTTERRGVKAEAEVHSRIFIRPIEGMKAEDDLAMTRAHWSIENKLHWIVDVAFREDKCRVYAANAVENLVVVRHIALNLLHSVKGLGGGIVSNRNQAAWTDDVRKRVLSASLG